jgi:hypothetical protein
LGVLNGGLGISELQFLIKKEKKKIVVFFSSIFCHQNPGSISFSDPDSLEMLDPDPDSMKPDPQHWLGNKDYSLKGPVFYST